LAGFQKFELALQPISKMDFLQPIWLTKLEKSHSPKRIKAGFEKQIEQGEMMY